MNTLMIILRLVHIGLGVFWAGAIFFLVIFLEPSVRAAGPDGASVARGLQKRQFLNVLPVAAALTIVSGLVLYWRVSAGLTRTWIAAPVGISLTVGGLASVIAFAIGVLVMRPATLRAMALGSELQQIPDGPAQDALRAKIQGLRTRARKGGRVVAVLLGVAVAAMAVGRYL